MKLGDYFGLFGAIFLARYAEPNSAIVYGVIFTIISIICFLKGK